MIEVTRLNGKTFILNSELIKFVEDTPDTVISLTTGEKMMVKESVSEVVRLSIEFRKRVHQEPLTVGPSRGGS